MKKCKVIHSSLKTPSCSRENMVPLVEKASNIAGFRRSTILHAQNNAFMRRYLFILLLVALSSCSVLTESQIKNINAFGASAKSYSGFPSTVLERRAALHLDEALIRTVQLPTPDQMKENLKNAQNAYNKALQLSDKFDLSLQLIQQYAGLLTRLSANNVVENLDKNTTELGENLSSLVETYNARVPNNKLSAGVTALLTKAIFLTGERLTRSKQAKALKTFMPQGDQLVQANDKNLVDVFETDMPSLKSELQDERTTFINTYTNVVLANPSRVDYNSIRKYTEALADYDNLEAMRKACVAAARQLALGHAQLAANIKTKKTVPEIFKETQDLIASVRSLYKLYQGLHNNNNTPS